MELESKDEYIFLLQEL